MRLFAAAAGKKLAAMFVNTGSSVEELAGKGAVNCSAAIAIADVSDAVPKAPVQPTPTSLPSPSRLPTNASVEPVTPPVLRGTPGQRQVGLLLGSSELLSAPASPLPGVVPAGPVKEGPAVGVELHVALSPH